MPAIMDHERLGRIVYELRSEVGYATGERRFAGELTTDDAADIADVLHEKMDDGTAARARLAVEHGVKIACGRGCTGCCEEMVIVPLPEALAVARWLARPENAERRAAFVAAYARWRAAAGDAPERLAALTVHNRDRADYTKAHVEYWRRRNLCAFNQDGDCTIYPVRPMVCRDAHAIETNERCFGDYAGGEPAGHIRYTPLVELVDKASHLLQAAHNALSDEPNRHEALCSAVVRLLQP
jgi:hypothetical protein